jgi:peptidoglycan/LPS O-acetylase OafA/YrhL
VDRLAVKFETKRFHIPSLDGIRGVAILCVFGAHIDLAISALMPGGLAVSAFFFLSGFLITTLLRREFEKTRGISLREFYLRRALRIFPPMYLVLLLALFLDLADGTRGFTGPVAIAQALYLTNYMHALGHSNDLVPYTAPFWSLAVEEHFYLAYPPALILLLRRYRYRQIALILASICAALLVWRCVLVFPLHVDSLHMYVATDARIDSILFGCILAFWNNPQLDKGFAPATAWKLAGCGTILVLGSLLIPWSAFSDTLRYTVQGLGLFPLFYCAVRFHDRPLFRWLETPLMRGLGIISYTFYLSHMACIKILERAFGASPIVILAAFAAAIAFSTASYFLLERRLAVLRARLKMRRTEAKPARAPVPPPAPTPPLGPEPELAPARVRLAARITTT